MSKLVLAQIGETEADRSGQFANSVESSLSPKGRYQARMGGLALASNKIDLQTIYIESRRQAKEAFKLIMLPRKRSASPIPATEIPYLKPRGYGLYGNTNMTQLRQQIGADRLHQLRTDWEEPIEDGESLQDVHIRVRSFHRALVLPKLLETPASNILILADRDPLLGYRAELDLNHEAGAGPISPDTVATLELGMGDMRVYTFDREGEITQADTLSPTHVATR